jgi:AcrR family transcriptional regulator
VAVWLIVADLRERKKAVLRGTIVRTAVELFAERGYDAVSVDEIASASMCSRSTFNRYFGTKEHVLFPGASEVTSGLETALAQADPAGDAWMIARTCMADQLDVFVRGFDADLRERCFRLWFEETAPRRRYLEFAFEWERILVAFFATRAGNTVDAQMRCQLLASAMVSTLRTALHGAIELGQNTEEITERAFRLLEAGLGEHTLRDGVGPARRARGR